MSKIIPSLFAMDLMDLNQQVSQCVTIGATKIHIDMMDGHFVEHIAFGIQQIKDLKPQIPLIFDVHLMVSQPLNYIKDLAAIGVEIISVHYESTPQIHEVLRQIREGGMNAGIALNPGTHVSVIEPLLDVIDTILVMSINPGMRNQKFIPSTLNRVAELKKIINQRDIKIEVDGSVSDQNIALLKSAGVDEFVVGSFLMIGNIKNNYGRLMAVLEQES